MRVSCCKRIYKEHWCTIKIKKHKGICFSIINSLLLVMSLMSGTLVVITSSDHKSNNFIDHNQQAFYVAETGLGGWKIFNKYFMGLPKREIAEMELSSGAANSQIKESILLM